MFISHPISEVSRVVKIVGKVKKSVEYLPCWKGQFPSLSLPKKNKKKTSIEIDLE